MFILIGNIFDNLRGNQKYILVAMELTMALGIFICGIMERNSYKREKEDPHQQLHNIYDILNLATTGAASSIIVITLV